MVRLLGLLSCLFALFMVPMSLRLLSDALSWEASGSGVYIVLAGVMLLTLASGYFGLRVLRRV
jgi:hypothetical protein